MSISKRTINIKGMHCRSCEILVEEELLKIKQVKKADVSHSKGTAEIHYQGTIPNTQIQNAIQSAGYSVGTNEPLPLISKNPSDYKELAIAFVIAIAFIFILLNLQLIKPQTIVSSDNRSLITVLLIGLVAGFSTCMALVGGLVIGVSGKYAKNHPNLTTSQKFIPHLWFNLGRIVGYTLFGAMIGLIGSVLTISTSITALLTIAVAIVMLILGGQLIAIFPKLSAVSITLPKSLSRLTGFESRSNQSYSTVNTMILGGLTFFLPCGFTQSMQLLAMASGSAMLGALIMGVFALGTTPGLLGIGGLTSIIRGRNSRIFFKTAGVIVLLMAFLNISNSLKLIGLPTLSRTNQRDVEISRKDQPLNQSDVNLVDGVQVIRMKQIANGYKPNSITLKKGIPVKWIITSETPYSCASSFIVPKLNFQKNLTSEETIIEFTPGETGTIPFSCTMGMYSGTIEVVE